MQLVNALKHFLTRLYGHKLAVWRVRSSSLPTHFGRENGVRHCLVTQPSNEKKIPLNPFDKAVLSNVLRPILERANLVETIPLTLIYSRIRDKRDITGHDVLEDLQLLERDDFSPESDATMTDANASMEEFSTEEITELLKKTDAQIAVLKKESDAFQERAAVLVSRITDEFVAVDHPRKQEFKEFLLQLVP